VFRGAVSGIQQRFEPQAAGTLTIWNFRLERQTDDGQPLPRIPVEISGLHFEGSIAEGDYAEVTGRWEDGETLHTEAVHNLSTGAWVRATTPRPERHVVRRTAKAVFVVVFFLIWVIVILAIVGVFLSHR
jgi:hypothetical protein